MSRFVGSRVVVGFNCFRAALSREIVESVINIDLRVGVVHNTCIPYSRRSTGRSLASVGQGRSNKGAEFEVATHVFCSSVGMLSEV